MEIEKIAGICHEVNRAYCQALGDFSQPSWEFAPDWQRESSINGVKLHLNNPLAGPEASHKGWMQQKIDGGWTYGEIKDPQKKQHPCMVQFEELPIEQKAKDYIFRAIVLSLTNI
jgi:hypothetical protein